MSRPGRPQPIQAGQPYLRLILFDGVCVFCNRAVRWLMRHDREGRFHYAPLQGDTAADLRRRHPEIPESIDTLVYVDASSGDECVYLRSESFFRVWAELGGVFGWLAWARLLPRWFTDACYRAFVRSRYRLFGRLDRCALPAPEERERILD